MPTDPYGRLPDTDLADIWQTDRCKFYRDRFAQRVQSYDSKLVTGLIRASGNRVRTLESARQAMPHAPRGCQVCHYLFNI